MSVFFSGLAIGAALAVCSSALPAQDSTSSLPPLGTRVRVWVPNPVPRTTDTVPRKGKLHEIDGRDILLKRFGTVEPLRIPASQIVRVERYVGGTTRARSATKGALIAASVPLTLGLLLTTTHSEEDVIAGAAMIVVGAPIAAAVGAIIGFGRARGERWANVPWPPSPIR